MDKPQSILETERENTDKSLNAERDKTNDSLVKVRAKTEYLTDKVVKGERRLADQITTSSRSKTDTARENKCASLGVKDKESEQLHDERRSADKATEQERLRTDAALVNERRIKDDWAHRLLEQEREETDGNLSVERDRTDAEVQGRSTLLSSEITEHFKTKTELTSRDEFLAIVSHDLKNPIGAASSCAALLLEESGYKDLDPEIRTLIQFIKRNNDTALRLIGDLLDMERVAEGRLQVKFGRHDIGRIIRESMETHAPAALEKKIHLSMRPPDIAGDILCDCDRIAQVVSNLIGNAIKFTPDGGSVTIDANFRKSELIVSIRDTGPGIPDDRKEKIFGRFVRLAASDRKGLGLGLHIAKMLVEAHQGRIWVESKIDDGSTFFFALPRLKSISQLGLQ